MLLCKLLFFFVDSLCRHFETRASNLSDNGMIYAIHNKQKLPLLSFPFQPFQKTQNSFEIKGDELNCKAVETQMNCS